MHFLGLRLTLCAKKSMMSAASATVDRGPAVDKADKLGLCCPLNACYVVVGFFFGQLSLLLEVAASSSSRGITRVCTTYSNYKLVDCYCLLLLFYM